ncbi:MAG: J domain-containing protein [Jaaginema sp. PMC 1079.18]|nr:J domain-containing protein [Jaaginema sp. PMC 1080.18]MEC4850347.1 J domain-containing protein [Jaaginema sp. PMC 1079.18]MEC4867145.1 J domain-containing protein [Jaaginema sp. PMC 1078.18]
MSFKIKRGLFRYDLIDHHAVLGIPLSADTKQVRKQYLKIARSLHPDTVKVKNDEERQQASEILSKLVNPAYEELSKSKTQAEYKLVLSQTGKRLAGEAGKVSVDSDAAKKLAQAGANADPMYQSAIKQLSAKQYETFENILDTIGQISELNMVYLMLKEGRGVKSGGATASSKPSTSNPANKPPTQKPDSEAKPVEKASPVDAYLRRAQEYIAKRNYAKATLELRDALRLDPNHSTCHSYLGLAYLQQKQVSMARVHINKAIAANPQDPMAIKAKKALEKVTGTSSNSGGGNSDKDSKNKSNKSSSGGLFGMFGGKKK